MLIVLGAAYSCIPNYDDLISGRGPCDGKKCDSAVGGSTQSSLAPNGGSSVVPGSGGKANTGGAISSGEQGGKTGVGGSGNTGGTRPVNDDPSCLPSASADDAGAPEVRLFGTATSDSEEVSKGNMAGNVLDCNMSTRWCASDLNTGHYVTIDLVGTHLLSRLEVMWEYPSWAVGGIYEYTVEVSVDSLAYTMAIDKSANTETTQTQSADFPSAKSARYVRLTVVGLPRPTASGQVTWASIYEVRIFGE